MGEVVPDHGVGQRKRTADADAGEGPHPEELVVILHEAGHEAGDLADYDDDEEELLPRDQVGEIADPQRDHAAQYPEDRGDVAAQHDVPLHVVQPQVAGDLGEVGRHQVLVSEQEQVHDGEEHYCVELFSDEPGFLFHGTPPIRMIMI